ncbi:LysR family transcriptional regulator [Solicola sp. PLA-1-18]|uniref:LysR family transcriptional regulator n=1 Tax=Solicola sp. PLA-1-18 TaxID=3380532 RepID=UPI003B7F213F
MDVRRLRILRELSRLGTMAAVGESLGLTTSTVSLQVAALARDVGTDLVEPDGRRVRLTPAGRRLAERAGSILAATDAALRDLDPDAEPAGTVRVAGFATAIRRSLLPAVAVLAEQHPAVTLQIREHEPPQSLRMLADDEVDLALVYRYDLTPTSTPPGVELTPLWSAAWGLGVPADLDLPDDGDSRAVVGHLRDHPWVVDSRDVADEQVVRTIAGGAGFEPIVTHRADSLDLLQEFVAAGLGVGLLPMDRPPVAGLRMVPLRDPGVTLSCSAAVRAGSDAWAPLALVLDLIARTD